MMKRLASLVAIVAAGVGFALQPAKAQIDTSTAEGQVAQVLRDVRLAAEKNDIEGMLKFYWNDPRLVVIDPDDGFKVHGMGEFRQYLQDRAKVQETLFWRTRHRQINVRGNNAYSTFYVTRQVRSGDTVSQKHERGTYVLKRIEDRWLIVSQHISHLPPIMRFQQTQQQGQ